jgi:hypothetical protein
MEYDYTARKRQEQYRKRMYENGFKQYIIWVKRKEPSFTGKMTQKEFAVKMKKLTARWDENDLSCLLKLLLKITESKKEEIKIRKK